MVLFFVDMITSILQSLLISYTVYYSMQRKSSIDKIKPYCLSIIYLIVGQVFTMGFGENGPMSIFVSHALTLIVTLLFYKKNILSAAIAYTLGYFILSMYTIIFGNLIFAGSVEMFPQKYIDYEKIFIMYVPEWIILIFCYKYRNIIKEIHRLISSENFSIMFIIMSFFMDFILTFYQLTLNDNSQLIKNIIYIIFFIFFTAVLFYFWKVHQKSEQIYKLNTALENKNHELRKIKHDYGAQISYLYGLCLMERFEDLKKSLKDIINHNEEVSTAVEVTDDEKSMLALALKPAIDKGIHVIIEENCDSKLINMNEMEFFRAVSNIVNNAIRAMNGNGIIIAKSYEYLGNVVIKIENNGPKIAEYHLNNIFKAGFTTKENGDKNHGYGLSIVKDLVERYNGKIFVKSTDVSTEFKIVLPIIQNV